MWSLSLVYLVGIAEEQLGRYQSLAELYCPTKGEFSLAFLFFLRRITSVAFLMSHPAVPTRLKVLPVLAFIYLIFPRDLFFDFRAFGILDDFVVVSVLLGIFINKAGKHVLEYNERRFDSIDADFQVLVREEGGPEDAPAADATFADGEIVETDEGDGVTDGDFPREDLRSRH